MSWLSPGFRLWPGAVGNSLSDVRRRNRLERLLEFPILYRGLTFFGASPTAAVEHVGGELDERLFGSGLAQRVLVVARRLRDYAEQCRGLAFPDSQPLAVEEDVAAVSGRIV